MWNPSGRCCPSPQTGRGGSAPAKSSNGIEDIYGKCALEVKSMTPDKQLDVDSKKKREAKEV